MQYSDKYFGQALADIIRKKQVKLRSLANKTNLNYSYFSKLKKKGSPPPAKTMEIIAEGLGISPRYFFEYRLYELNRLLLCNPELASEVIAYVKKAATRRSLKIADGKNPFTKNGK